MWTEMVQNLPEYGPVPVAVRAGGSPRNGGFGLVAFIGVGLVVAALVAGLMVWVSRVQGPGGEAAATSACRVFVATRLRAPDTAVFTSLEAIKLGGNQWTVTGAVDSRSAGGTTERTGFTCTVSPDDGRWQLDRLRLDVPTPRTQVEG
jgi:hypothetical protein